MRAVRLFGREPYEQERFERSSDRARRETLQVGVITASIQPLTEVLYVLLFTGILFAWHGHVGLPTLLAFLLLLYRLQPHVKALDHCRVEIAGLLPAISEVTALIDARDKPYLRSGTRAFQGLRDAVTFSNVDFHYDAADDRRRALVNVGCPAGCLQGS